MPEKQHSTIKPTLKVYGWHQHNSECPSAQNGMRQCRHICAASSIASLMKITDLSRHYLTTYCSITGNQEEIDLALSEPGVVFWKAEHYQGEPGPKEWKRKKT